MQKLQPSKIEALLKKLTNGRNVSLRDLENVLGLVGLVEYERLWNEELDRRKFFEVKPTALADYEAMDFPYFSRHLIMSKMKWRGLYETHQIYGRI